MVPPAQLEARELGELIDDCVRDPLELTGRPQPREFSACVAAGRVPQRPRGAFACDVRSLSGNTRVEEAPECALYGVVCEWWTAAAGS